MYRAYPNASFGIGYGYYYGPTWGPYHYYNYGWGYDPWFYHPWYSGPTDFYPINVPGYWDWKTGEVRFRLVYEDNGTNFEHNFTFDRQRIK